MYITISLLFGRDYKDEQEKLVAELRQTSQTNRYFRRGTAARSTAARGTAARGTAARGTAARGTLRGKR